MSHNTFAALGVSAELVAALDARGLTSPFQIQTRAIPPALAGTELLAKSPTGSGKTLAFAIPLVERIPRDDARPSALVLVPTRELALQVSEEIESPADALDLWSPPSTAASPPRPSQPRPRRPRDRRHPWATPGPPRPAARHARRRRDPRPRRGRPDARHGLQAAGRPDRQAPPARSPDDVLLGDARRRGRRARARVHAVAGSHRGGAPERPHTGEIEHRFVPVTADTKVSALVELLQSERGLALVFVRTKRGADRLARKLAQQGVKAAAMHGDLTQGQRQRALERFESGA